MSKEIEFRKGNYIYYEKTTHIVDGILNGKIYSHWIGSEKNTISNDYVCDISEIELIPLTVDWLLKFGFKQDSDLKNSLVKNGIWFNRNNMECTYLSQKLIKIEYVHQLQNLYLDLTGEELTIL